MQTHLEIFDYHATTSKRMRERELGISGVNPRFLLAGLVLVAVETWRQ